MRKISNPDFSVSKEKEDALDLAYQRCIDELHGDPPRKHQQRRKSIALKPEELQKLKEHGFI